MNSEIRIAIASDYPLFLRSLAAWINAEPGISICGSFADAGGMVRWYDGSNADVLVFDNETGVDTIEECRFAKEKLSDAKIIFLSSDDETVDSKKLILFGISAWFNKSTNPDAILNGIRSICQRDRLRDSKNLAADNERHKAKLSKREIEIIKHITQGKTTLQIGNELNLSPLTVKTHRQNLLKKLNVSNTPQLLEGETTHLIVSKCYDYSRLLGMLSPDMAIQARTLKNTAAAKKIDPYADAYFENVLSADDLQRPFPKSRNFK